MGELGLLAYVAFFLTGGMLNDGRGPAGGVVSRLVSDRSHLGDAASVGCTEGPTSSRALAFDCAAFEMLIVGPDPTLER